MKRYPSGYLSWRRGLIDRSEWLDILWALRGLGVPRNARIVELGAGEGLLLRFLRENGYTSVVGVDLLYEDEYVMRLDLASSDPPEADLYISQHVLEHLPVGRTVRMLYLSWHSTRLGIGIHIVPGHYTGDPTHVVDHYTYPDIVRLIRDSKAPHYHVEPDTMSYVNPAARDWIVIVSRKPIPPNPVKRPKTLQLVLKLARKLLNHYTTKTHKK